MDETFNRDGIQTRVVHAARALNTTHSVNPPIWQTSTLETSEAFLPAQRGERSLSIPQWENSIFRNGYTGRTTVILPWSDRRILRI